jgi:trimeric autotransporter adhesin
LKRYFESNRASRGIAATALIILVVVIVVVAGAGGYAYYVSVAPKSSTTTTAMTSASSSTTASGSTTASSSASSASTSSATTSSSSLQLVENIGDVIGNFTQMELGINATSSSGTTNATLSYFVAGSGTNSSNGVKLTWVNYTFSGLVNGTTPESYSYVIYYNSSWDAVAINAEGTNITDAADAFLVQTEAEAATVYFSILFNYQSSYINSTIISQLTMGTTTKQTFGMVTMNVTPYTASSLTENGTTVTNFQVNIGSIPSTSFSMVTYLAGSFSGGSAGSGSYSFDLISATQPS